MHPRYILANTVSLEKVIINYNINPTTNVINMTHDALNMTSGADDTVDPPKGLLLSRLDDAVVWGPVEEGPELVDVVIVEEDPNDE